MIGDLDVQHQLDGASASKPGFDDFFRENEVRVLLFLMRLGAEPEEAQDVFQDAMLQVYLRWDKIDQPRAYLRAAAERIFLRSQVRTTRLLQREAYAFMLGERDGADGRSSLTLLLLKEDTRAVLDALRKLPPQQRRVMAWSMDGYSPAEISEKIGTPENTVRSNLRHAKTALRQLYAERKNKVTGTSTGRGIGDGQRGR